jgi:hypothetical protein
MMYATAKPNMIFETVSPALGKFEITPEVRRTLKIGYAARLVDNLPEKFAFALLLPGQVPQVGDVILARVKKLGRHTKLDDCNGRRTALLEGDLLIGVYGNRYATDQFEGEVPLSTERCHILSVAGVCGVVKSRHSAMSAPTEIEVVGFVYDNQGTPINLLNFGLTRTYRSVPAAQHYPDQPRVIVVTGASMNSGKTTTAANIVRGLVQNGYRVAAGKITGTACGNDTWDFQDNGAVRVLDFSDCGFPSTYLCSEKQLMQIYRTLYHELNAAQPDFIVFEIADGVVQRESLMLLTNTEFRASVHTLVYAAGDSLAAEAGVRWLGERGYQIKALSGLISASPLAKKEAENLTGLRCYTREELASGRFSSELFTAPSDLMQAQFEANVLAAYSAA